MVTEPADIELAYKAVDWAPTDSGRIMALIGAVVATGVGLRIAFVAPVSDSERSSPRASLAQLEVCGQ
jgi:hypothetical protein